MEEQNTINTIVFVSTDAQNIQTGWQYDRRLQTIDLTAQENKIWSSYSAIDN